MPPPPPPPEVPAPQQPQPLRPSFVATHLKFGVIGDGTNLAIAFGFIDGATGNELPPVILTNDLGGITPQLAEELTKIVAQVSPEEAPAPIVTCSGCGRRVFGDIAERGVCLTCKPA